MRIYDIKEEIKYLKQRTIERFNSQHFLFKHGDKR